MLIYPALYVTQRRVAGGDESGMKEEDTCYLMKALPLNLIHSYRQGEISKPATAHVPCTFFFSEALMLFSLSWHDTKDSFLSLQ